MQVIGTYLWWMAAAMDCTVLLMELEKSEEKVTSPFMCPGDIKGPNRAEQRATEAGLGV